MHQAWDPEEHLLDLACLLSYLIPPLHRCGVWLATIGHDADEVLELDPDIRQVLAQENHQRVGDEALCNCSHANAHLAHIVAVVDEPGHDTLDEEVGLRSINEYSHLAIFHGYFHGI